MKLIAIAPFFAIPLVLNAATPNPTLFYTDLISGPVGAIVTVYGANLQPNVELSGVQATIVASSSSKVSFVVPQASSGSITMLGSNALPFTVRSGNIYYVANSGSDSNPGSSSRPWGDIPYGFNTANCGDIVYVMDGVQQTKLDNYNASLSVERVCTSDSPLALVGYPGATVTIGSTTGAEYGIRNPDVNGDGYNGMVFANLTLRGNNESIKTTGNQYWRIVGNDLSCPFGGGESACALVDQSSNIQFLGNSIHNAGAGGTKYYHSFYATTNSNHIEVGWNHIYNNQSCRGIQFYSTGGNPQYDLVVHDNIISDEECDGINFSTVDATLGPIEAYNNLIYHVGLGGTTDGLSNYACIASLGYGNPGGTAIFFGNTLSDCGSAGGSTAGAITVASGSPTVLSISNLVMQNPGEPIYSSNTDMSFLQPASDVLLTNGTAGVVDANFRLVSGSPAIGAGTSLSGILYDLAGTPRPQSGSSDAGAYLYQAGGSTTGPTAALTPGSIVFGSVTAGVTSSAQTATLSNSGGSALTITSISIVGANAANFHETNTCGASLAAGSSCTIAVTFSPTAAGAYTATLSVADNVAGSPQTVTLTGTETALLPAAIITPTRLNFGSITAGSTSPAQTVTLSNSGGSALTISSISIVGANVGSFHQTNTCGTSLAAGSSCAIAVTFSPATAGTFTATLSVADNASGSPQTVTLTGTGRALSPLAILAPARLNFGSITAGSTSPPQTVTLSNGGGAALAISSISLTGANPGSFSQTNTCGTSLAAGSTCTIAVIFSPTAVGTFAATLNVSDNASSSSQIAILSGTGAAVPPPAGFSVSATPGSATMPAGGSTTFTVTVQPTGGSYTNVVSLSVSGLPQTLMGTFNPSSVTPNSASVTSILTIAPSGSARGNQFPGWIFGVPAFATALLIPICFQKRRVIWSRVLLAGMGAGLLEASGCGGGTFRNNANSGTPQTYTLTISGTNGSTVRTATVQLTVN